MKQNLDNESRIALIEYRMKRANETLSEAIDIASRGYFNTAINRLYYSCYYAVNALLIKNDISAYTHAGVKQMLGVHFITTNKLDANHGRFYAQIFNNRITSDYDDFVTFDKITVDALIPLAQQFIQEIERIINQ